jgi:hypothetical protein
MAGCCECGDEPSGSCATELVRLVRSPDCLSVYSYNSSTHWCIFIKFGRQVMSLKETMYFNPVASTVPK